MGPAFLVRFSPELLQRVDAEAAEVGVKRPEWLRRAASAVLDPDGWRPAVVNEDQAAGVEAAIAALRAAVRDPDRFEG
ncbi:hypothetical protein CGZ93_10470 [Enemella dayhoffiae]|uniref:Ribbon-helix-helix protein, CopG family n=1 Tax=Enemella dayhoffiae TaxID=2016507 RepID=A0A255H2P9_9ACTN|nr:hypothetical protein [Enemella dayhoffiae]OYO21493.1 hypothetical protein CGZ93_10470 [Enemella dayhoffiae]